MSQHFLPLVAEGRIVVKPWISAIQGQGVRFSDESFEEFDAIIFGTGFELSLPFLSPAICRTLNLDALNADLYKFTFHPDLTGLAFLGLWEQTGPYFPPLELHARWISYVWSGIRPLPPRDQMKAGAEAKALGTVVSSEFSGEQVAQLRTLAAARKEAAFTEFVDRITKS